MVDWAELFKVGALLVVSFGCFYIGFIVGKYRDSFEVALKKKFNG